MRKIGVTCIGLLGLCLGASCQQQQASVSGLLFRGPISAAGETSPSTVLIIPTNEADKAVEQRIHDYVRGIQALMVNRDVKVLADAEVLQTDLSQNALMVYGTPQGNLWLSKHIAALPVVIEPDGIAADRRCKGSNLRFISTWPHPQNGKLGVVIYTAQRAEDIVGINSVLHGPTDYLVARDRTILHAGDYVDKEDRWAFAPLQLDLAQAVQDLDFMFRTIEQVHPDCRANLSRAGYTAIKKRSHEALRRAGADTGQVPISVLSLTAAEAAAAIGDAHTACHLPKGLTDPGDPTPCMPPFRLRWDTGHVVIDKTIGGLEGLAGARLLQIDGRPFDEAVGSILAHVSGERQAFRTVRFLGWQEVWWALVRPVQGEEMSLTIRRGAQEPETIKAPLISLARYRQELPPGRGSGDFHEFHHDGRTCYWRYNSFDDFDAAYKSIDTVFKDIREHNARTLIIDLRFNGGGSSMPAKYILHCITNKPYRFVSRDSAKISEHYPGTERLGIFRPVGWLLRGCVLTMRFSPRPPRDMEYEFDGLVYAIVGPVTSSTASDFAHVLKDYHIGTLVGEETGGVRQSFGACLQFRMPHSNLPFMVSTKLFYAPIPRPGDAAHGSMPDIFLTDDRLAPFADAKDPQIAFILDLIEKQSAAK